MTVRDSALMLAVYKALEGLIREHSEGAKKDTHAALAALMAETGATSVKVDLPGLGQVATVTLAAGKPSARVADERAFLNWVCEHAPTEVEPRVRETYRRRLLDEATKMGAACTANGEAIDGVEITEAEPYVSTRFVPGGRDAIGQAWRTGQLPASLPALPGGAS